MQNSVAPSRAASVLIGPQSSFYLVSRLVAMELYKIRRRVMSKALLLTGLGVIAGFMCIIGLTTIYQVNRPLSAFTPAICSVHQVEGCVSHTPTVTDQQNYRQSQINKYKSTLLLPSSLNNMTSIIADVLAVLIIILMGSIVGGEYSLGTVRLMFTRGPTRLQFHFAKLIAVIICLIPFYLIITLCGIVLGQLLGLLAGITTDFSFLTAILIGHFSLFLLLGMLTWFVYAIMASFFGAVGRSTVAAIVGPLVWVSVEPLLTKIITVVAGGASGTLADIAQNIPNYFVGNNISSLLSNQGYILFNGHPGTIPDWQALIVIAIYIIAFIAISSWFTARRDVTH